MPPKRKVKKEKTPTPPDSSDDDEIEVVERTHPKSLLSKNEAETIHRIYTAVENVVYTTVGTGASLVKKGVSGIAGEIVKQSKDKVKKEITVQRMGDAYFMYQVYKLVMNPLTFSSETLSNFINATDLLISGNHVQAIQTFSTSAFFLKKSTPYIAGICNTTGITKIFGGVAQCIKPYVNVQKQLEQYINDKVKMRQLRLEVEIIDQTNADNRERVIRNNMEVDLPELERLLITERPHNRTEQQQEQINSEIVESINSRPAQETEIDEILSGRPRTSNREANRTSEIEDILNTISNQRTSEIDDILNSI